MAIESQYGFFIVNKLVEIIAEQTSGDSLKSQGISVRKQNRLKTG